MVREGVVWYDMVREGVVWCGVVREEGRGVIS